jgi:hypothetical protein
MSKIPDSLFRIYLRLAGGKAQWHRRFYRPSVTVVVGDDKLWFEEEDFCLKALPLAKLVASVASANNSTAGTASEASVSKRCNICLSGPSVKSIKRPLEMTQYDWMGVNGSPGVFGDSLPQMRFYHVNDTGYIQANRDNFYRYAARADYTIVDYRAVFELLSHRDPRLSAINLVVYDSWAYPLFNALGQIERLSQAPNLESAWLSKDPRLGLPTGGTVAYTGAQILALAGYDSIFFYGLDLSNSGRSYAEASAQPQMLDKALHRVIIPSFRLFKREWSEVKCFNCNLESMLPDDVMPKIDADASWEDCSII